MNNLQTLGTFLKWAVLFSLLATVIYTDINAQKQFAENTQDGLYQQAADRAVQK